MPKRFAPTGHIDPVYDSFFQTTPRTRHTGDYRRGTKSWRQRHNHDKKLEGHPWWLVAWKVLA